MTLTAPAFANSAPIPRRHAGDGEDLSPALSWEGAPPGTRELVLIVDDPDAPSPQPWVHWVIHGLPGELTSLAEGVHQAERPPWPEGAVQGRNGWGTIGYRGPAPPRGHGAHRYVFRLHALDAALGLPPGLGKDEVLARMKGHVLATGELMGTYERFR